MHSVKGIFFKYEIIIDVVYMACVTDEADRIRRSRGRVFALKDEPGMERAWLPRICSPGIAMSRAFGDCVMKHYGIIATPVITHHCITSDDQFILLASDGVSCFGKYSTPVA